MASIFRGLEEDNYDRQYTDGQLYRRIAGYFARRSGKFLSFVGLALLSSFLLGIEPILISEVVRVLENRTILSPVYLILGILTMNILIEYGANWLRRRLAGRTISGVVADMRKEAFQAAIYRDLAFYDKNKTGKILSRISNDTQEFGTIVLISSDIISQIISVMILLVVLFRRDVTLTLWLLGTIPLLVGLSMVFRHWAKITTRNGSRALGLVNDNIQESVAGIAVAKNFRKEKMIYDEFLKVNNTSYRVNVVRGGVLSLVFPSLNVMAGLVIALIVYLGANRVFAQQINVSTWFLFVLAVDRFFFPAITLSSFISQIQQGLSSVERVFSLIDYQNEVQQIAKQPITRRLEGKIEFKQVGFGYTPEHPVFQEFSLTIAPKEKLAIVGHTGSGKSSLAKLVTRFYEFQSGQLLIDGVDIRSLDVSAYRQQLGIVSQTPFLFSGSIREQYPL
jgi:ATP-binding cassette subfamily B protein